MCRGSHAAPVAREWARECYLERRSEVTPAAPGGGRDATGRGRANALRFLIFIDINNYGIRKSDFARSHAEDTVGGSAHGRARCAPRPPARSAGRRRSPPTECPGWAGPACMAVPPSHTPTASRVRGRGGSPGPNVTPRRGGADCTGRSPHTPWAPRRFAIVTSRAASERSQPLLCGVISFLVCRPDKCPRQVRLREAPHPWTQR